MLYATNMDTQILVMWTRSSSNVAKYLSDTITDQIRIFISHDSVEECSNNYMGMKHAWSMRKWSVPKENKNGLNNYDDHFEEVLLET